jgi:aminocarboxymuconate-semialdehyde decarboxylase
MAIDAHAHYMPPSTIDAYRDGTDWFGTTFSPGPDGNTIVSTAGYTLEIGPLDPWNDMPSRLGYMDSNGVDAQLISLNPILNRYYIDAKPAVAAARVINDEMREAVAGAPTRLAGLGVLPAQDPDSAVSELHRCVEELGFPGAAIGTHVDGANWDEPQFRPIFQAASELGAVLFIHPTASRVQEATPRYHMRNYIGNPLETTIALGSIIFGGILDQCPDLKLIAAHGGGFLCWGIRRMDHGYSVRPEARENIEKLPTDYARQIYFDSLTHDHDNLRFLVERMGAERVVLGTDYPADMGQENPVDWINASDLDAATQAKVLDSNVRALLGEKGRILQGASQPVA